MLRLYLLATGERGLGFGPVFGHDVVLSAREFELFSMLQDRVALASSEEGKKQMGIDAGVRRALALEQRELREARAAREAREAQALDAPIAPDAQQHPLDLERMSSAEVAEWLAEHYND